VDLGEKEVIAPPESWGGTFGPFEFAGARLVQADADHWGNIHADCIPRLATPTTAAVVAVDWKGTRHDSVSIRQQCDLSGLLYIEDTAFIPPPNCDHHCRSLADIQVISFGPGKLLTLGEGGALLTRHRWIYERAVSLSQHPERCAAENVPDAPAHPFINARMHPMAAVLGVALLDR
jgi:dTDP-4-amino-4,6-dideoxygalactose transaminase